jgi:hypothetical protein
MILFLINLRLLFVTVLSFIFKSNALLTKN